MCLLMLMLMLMLMLLLILIIDCFVMLWKLGVKVGELGGLWWGGGLGLGGLGLGGLVEGFPFKESKLMGIQYT